jgi:tetratricopeptide (TPR) repeat protein
MSAESDNIAEQIDRARALTQQGQFEKALAHLHAQLGEDVAQHVEALYIRALCQRQLAQYQQALDSLRQLVELDSGYARAYQEIGHLHNSVNNSGEAIRGFEDAVALNPALVASWRELARLYQAVGNETGHRHAATQAAQLEALPRELVAVKSHLNTGNLVMADQICRHFLRTHKQDIEGMRLLAEIASRARIVDDAEFLLESAVAFEPGHVGARVDYANILVKRQKFARASEVAASLVESEPGNAQFKSLLATTRLGLGETQFAIEQYESVLEEVSNPEYVQLSLGHAFKTIGKLERAVAAYRAVYALRPDFGDAFWSLANTKTYMFPDSEIEHMQDYEARATTSALDRIHFCFALGKAWEDRQDFQRSFEFYRRGNELKREELSYRSPITEKRVAAQQKVCTRSLFEERGKLGFEAPDPIFIVGLPRAGSTLLEQILASHSQVDGTLELPDILSLAYRLGGREAFDPAKEPQYPAILATLDGDFFRRFGEQYLENTRVYRSGAPLFIDKMPNNFLHIGLIRLILPKARIIDARRHPMSCCFSGFKQLFAEGQEYTYGLLEIGNYYRNYVALMQHWEQVLPGFVLRVQHEDVVNDLEGQVRRMLDFLGLPFERSCVDFHETRRNVRTPSSEQVRQPIFQSSLEQWRNYEPWLGPLKEALGPELLEQYQ